MEDEQIMLEVRAGDVSRLETLFERYHRPLFQFFLHLTAQPSMSEDLVQEVFFRILKYRRSYQPAASFRNWMYQVARNVHHDHAGRHAAEVSLGDEVVEFRGPEAPPDRQAQTRQEAVLLRRALAAMPPDKREVLVMSRFLDLKYEEIAAILKCEVGTVKVRVYRALRDLGDRFFALTGERAS